MNDERFAAARAHFSAGLGHLQAGRLADAETDLRASLALLPGRASTLCNLAATVLHQGRAAEALPLLDEVLAQDAHDVEALGHRGIALNQLRRPDEARQAFERLLQLAPDRPEAWFHLGQTLQVLEQPAAAVQAYDRCLALRPGHAASHSQRGSALKDLGRLNEAVASYERALALGDDSELNTFYLAALKPTRGRGADAPPPTAPRAYVERLFDDYAPEFDQHLVQVLGYCAPDVLQRLLLGLDRAGFGRFVSALDLGCGTGLCGPLLRPMVDTLCGVDLSAVMLDAARGRGVYDSLLQADLVDHLLHTDVRHDLIVAADVFIYVGDLAPVFAAVRRVLAPGGVFAFSVEPAARDQTFVLQTSLRYAHGEPALHALAAQQGLQVVRAEHHALRVDQASQVQGQYWVLQAASETRSG